ncbi:MAG: sulfatase [Acidobacteria bacterium]|nr:sulfatase [Acidobacteriota bacterium]
MSASRSITRRRAAAAIAGTALAACSRRRRPNILFVMCDDHAWGEMSCYGNRILQTPNMDKLAAGGTRFANAFCTNSLCAPSRATALTGCYSHIHGVRGNSESKDANERLRPGIATWPKLLQQAGYHTGMAGKWHLNDQPEGFDYWCVLPGQGVYFDPEFIENGRRRKIQGYVTDITTGLALQFLEQAGDRPFALAYQHKAPHRPFTPAPRHAGLFSDRDLPYPAGYDDDYATRRLAREAEDMKFDVSLAGDYQDLPPKLPPAERKRWIYQRFVKDHYRAVAGVDENLGRVLDYLDKRRLADDTLILYTSDNGFFLGEHGWYDKRFMYEPSLRVPLLARYPRSGAAGRVERAMALNIDFAPTILDFAGVPVPAQMQGRSLRPLIEGRIPPDWRQSIYYTYFENSWALRGKSKEAMSDPGFQYFTAHRVSPHRGVRTARYKLIEYYSEGGYWELFDLETDPHEMKNLHGTPGYEAITAQLRNELVRLRTEYRDT